MSVSVEDDLLLRHLGRSRAEEISHSGVYLDHAGAPLPCKSLIQAVCDELLSHSLANPHTVGASSSERTQSIVTQAREETLRHCGLSADEYLVVFTASATAAIKLAGEVFPWTAQSNLWISQNAHTSLLGLRSFVARETESEEENRERESDAVSRAHCFFEKSLFPAFYDSPSLFQTHRDGLCDRIKRVSPSQRESESKDKTATHHLLALPGECNLSGAKLCFPAMVQLLQDVHSDTQRYWWLLDAAKLAGSTKMNIDALPSALRPQFIALSFYKIFGYPSGLGALLIKRDVLPSLKKRYFGGGTLLAGAADSLFQVSKPSTSSEHFEDGTLNFHAIAAIRHGFRFIDTLGGMSAVSAHTHQLRRFLQREMRSLCHHDDPRSPLCVLYHDETHSQRVDAQGAVLAFNVKYADGSAVSFHEVSKLARTHHIDLRTGCFCNLGGCQLVLNMSSEDVRANYRLGRVCSADHNEVDVINGRNTGLCRLSLGYGSVRTDCERFLTFLREQFLNKQPVQPALHAMRPMVCERTARERREGEDESSVFSLTHEDEKLFWNKDVYSFPFATLHTQQRVLSSHTPHTSPHNRDNYVNNGENTKCVRALFVFPVKSCGAVRVDHWPATRREGLLFDRCLAIVDAHGRVVNQKQFPQLALVQPAFALHYDERERVCVGRAVACRFVLQLTAVGMDSVLEITLDAFESELLRDRQRETERETEEESEFRVCGRRLRGKNVSRDADKWISHFLSLSSSQRETQERARFRLIRSAMTTAEGIHKNKEKDTQRVRENDSDKAVIDTAVTSFANTAQYLMLSMASVKALVQMIRESSPEESSENVKVENFRPNIVVSTQCRRPHVEDRWSRVSFPLHHKNNNHNNTQSGEDDGLSLSLSVSGPCSRCSMVNVNGRTGIMDCRVFDALKDYRKLGSSVYFGEFLTFHSVAGSGGGVREDEENELFVLRVGGEVISTDKE